MICDTYSQGAELRYADNQIKNLEESIETASKHEVANFDALVSQAQRDLDDLNSNQPLIELYDETELLVHSRVNRRDALLLERTSRDVYDGQLATPRRTRIQVTNCYHHSGVFFGSDDGALSQLMGGDQSF